MQNIERQRTGRFRGTFRLGRPAFALALVASMAACGGSRGDDGTLAATAGATTSSGAVAASSPAASTATPTASAPTTPTPVATTAARAGVGVNLSGLAYYASEIPTIDFMKKAGGWLTQCTIDATSGCTLNSWDTQEEAKLDLDADGWLRSLPAAASTTASYRFASTMILSGGYQPAGKYVVLYDGQGTLLHKGVGAKVAAESTPGRDVVLVTNDSTAGWWLTITATNPANYLRNIRVYPPGGVCAGDTRTTVADASACTTTAQGSFVPFETLAATQPWYPEFLKEVHGFRTLRFMDWGATNGNLVASWSDRTSATARTWDPASGTGVPIERMFDLAKAAGADPWMNLPPHVDDDYIHQFGQLAHAQLGAGQTLYLEYGNEMWNYAFPATKWAFAQAQTAFATQLAAGADPYVLESNWYAQRLVQACQIVKGEFGADASRVHCVSNTQAANPWSTNQTLLCTYAAPALGKACGKFLDGAAIAPYFGTYVGNASLRAVTDTWTGNAGSSGLTAMFAELTGQGPGGAAIAPPLAASSGAPKGAVSQANDWMVGTKTVLDTYGLPMLAYEGGQGLVIPVSSPDVPLLNLMIAANRDARMGPAYEQMMSDWKAAGGQDFNFFTDVGVPSQYGMWGLRETQADESAPKWVAAKRWRDQVACWWTGC